MTLKISVGEIALNFFRLV